MLVFLESMVLLWCTYMLTSLLVSMFLRCNLLTVCYLMMDYNHLGLYSLFAFLLARIHLGKWILTVRLFCTFLSYCCVLICGYGCCCWTHLRRLCRFLLKPQSCFWCFLLHLLITVYFLFPELLGGCVECCVQFVDLVYFTFVHSCHQILFECCCQFLFCLYDLIFRCNCWIFYLLVLEVDWFWYSFGTCFSAPYIVATIMLGGSSRYHPLVEWGAYDSMRSVFLCICIAHPNGAIGMKLKSCGPFRYTYADTFGVPLYCCIRFTCISVCRMNLSQRFSGNKLSTPHSTDLNCPLKLCLYFSDKIMSWIPDGTNSYCIPLSSFFSMYASEFSLSRICPLS